MYAKLITKMGKKINIRQMTCYSIVKDLLKSIESVLITGGTGSFGKKFIQRILEKNPKIERLVIFSRDELKQYELSKVYSEEDYPGIRYFLGDIRDEARLIKAMEGIDTVIHAAALKQVPAAEYNPFEFVKTNILGSENVVNAACTTGVKRVVALSTDKASAPINLYGATKLCSDKLFVTANYVSGKKDIKFSVVRYGNVMMSRGSVIPYFLNLPKGKKVPITHPEMTRFSISLDSGVDLVLHAIENAMGGEIFVPKIPSYKIIDVAKAIHPGRDIEIIGTREGEKIHESMITQPEALNTYELEDKFIIMPSGKLKYSKEEYLRNIGAKLVDKDFEYASNINQEFLSVDEIRRLINEEIAK